MISAAAHSSRRPRLIDGQSILHLDVPLRPTTKSAAANAAGPQALQQPKRDRGDDKQVYRRDTVGMIAKEGLPALRRRPPSQSPQNTGRSILPRATRFGDLRRRILSW